MIRVVAALDSFKGSLGSAACGAAVRDGVLDAAPDAVVAVVAVADGGEGTLDALATLGGETVDVDAVDALGRPLRVTHLVMSDGTAVVEAARTVGLERLDQVDDTVPPRASSVGLGTQLAAALAGTTGRVLVGLGGTATTDGGTGMLLAMGADLGLGRVAPDGNPLLGAHPLGPVDPATLPDLGRVVVLSDVTNLLLGERGAARVFGPQKGATPDQVDKLDARMGEWAEALAAAGRPVADRPGAGAAGGLGAALMACGATVVPGFSEVARLTGLAEAVAGADLVVTGEGSVDVQTAMGKAPAGVAALAREQGAAVVALGGRVDRDATSRLEETFDAVLPIHSRPRPEPEAMDPEMTAAELRATAAEVVRLLLAVRR